MDNINLFNPYLSNPAILEYIDTLQVKTQFVRVVVLNWQDLPIKSIEGHVTGGNLNVNNNSAVRRSGSLSLVTELKRNMSKLEIMNEVTNTDTLISMNKRVQIEIGIQNSGNQYLQWDIFWFPCGVYIISNASVSYNNQGIAISLNLRDKMSLLNGDAGGVIPASVIISDDTQPVLFYDIIETTVSQYGGIPKNKILIEDIDRQLGESIVTATRERYFYKEKEDADDVLKEVLSYTYDTFQFLPDEPNNYNFQVDISAAVTTQQMSELSALIMSNRLYCTFNCDQKRYIGQIKEPSFDSTNNKLTLFGIDGIEKEALSNELIYLTNEKRFWINVPEGAVLASQNQPLCYVTKQPFTYPGVLSANGGDTVVTILDTIKNKLGNFEYFFDLNGVFRFREIKNYLNEGSAIENLSEAINEKYFVSRARGKIAYSFNESNLITAYTNAPQYNLIKNDYNVWGQLPDTKNAIHYHLIIESLPGSLEKRWWVIEKEKNENGNWVVTKATSYDTPDDAIQAGFLSFLQATEIEEDENYVIPTVDSQFITEESEEDVYSLHLSSENNTLFVAEDNWREKMYLDAVETDSTDVFAQELRDKLPMMMDVTSPDFAIKDKQLMYFLDAINTNDSSLMYQVPVKQFSISNIGRRGKVINDEDINCLFNIPPAAEEFAFHTEKVADRVQQIDNNSTSSIVFGVFLNSAYEALRSSIHQHLSYNNNITLTTMPIYHLDVNQRIKVDNAESNIHGDYVIQSLSIPLNLDGMMTINATQAVERI